MEDLLVICCGVTLVVILLIFILIPRKKKDLSTEQIQTQVTELIRQWQLRKVEEFRAKVSQNTTDDDLAEFQSKIRASESLILALKDIFK